MDEQSPGIDGALTSALLQLGGIVLTAQAVDSILERVAALAHEHVPGADTVSITLARGKKFDTSNSTSPLSAELDQVQYGADRGPCLEAIRTTSAVNAALSATADRWPELAAAAQAQGIGSVLSLPLNAQDDAFGGLNVYGRGAEGFAESDAATGEELAKGAAVIVANAIALASAENMNVQLREALVTRDVIGQAKGILMSRENCTPDEAFDILRRASQRLNQKLHDVAADVVRSVEQHVQQPSDR